MVAVQYATQFIRVHVPDEDTLSDAARRHQAAIGRPAAPENGARVTLERLEHVPVVTKVPDLTFSKIKMMSHKTCGSRLINVLSMSGPTKQ